MRQEQTIPVHILSGFLGSGKTTLLTRALDYYQLNGRKPAVLMNELGEVNLDGMLVDSEVPMTEMLGGCICCTIRGDLGLELKQLVNEHRPDVVLVESTGAANPMEMLDGVTDASLLTRVKLASVVTVVDAALFAEKSVSPKSRTYRLMADQIRCATLILFNKTDLVPSSELSRLEGMIRELNPSAPILRTVRSEIDFTLFDRLEEGVLHPHHDTGSSCTCAGDHSQHEDYEHHACAVHDTEPHHDHSADGQPSAHHSHDHVMAYTHFFTRAIDSERFEALVGRLPHNIFRAKGILRFTDTASPFMFQYAYRQMDFMKIAPKEHVPSVAVFIGDHFDRSVLEQELIALERTEP